MKLLLTVLFLAGFLNAVNCQNKLFLRFYSNDGTKFNRGYFVRSTDSSIFIKKGIDTVEINYSKIGNLKTRRSLGNDIYKSSLISAGLLAAFFYATGVPDEKKIFIGWHRTEGLAIGLTLGGLIGPAIGGITATVKKVTTVQVKGDQEAWLKAKALLETLKQ